MTNSIFRLNHFISAANQAASMPTKCLQAGINDLSVSIHDEPSSLTQQEKDVNKQSWRIFRETLVGTIGQRKFDWICHRYRSKINFITSERSGDPLLPQHVELFSIGSSQVLARDIKDRFPEKLKTIPLATLRDRIQRVQPFSIVGTYKNPEMIYGSPGTRLANYFHDKVLMDKEKQLLFSDVGRLSFTAWLERICKVTVNREFLEGQLLAAPGPGGLPDYYKVHKKIATGDGLVAYALKPATLDSHLKPLIIFRPSQWALSNEDALETYRNDVQPSVGEDGWKGAEPLFDQLMQDPHFRTDPQRIAIAGYSLGGVHAQYLLAKHFDKINQATFYNDPSSPDETAEKAATAINAMPRRPEDPLYMQIIRIDGDPCHYVGGKHVGWGITHPDVKVQLQEVDHNDKQISVFFLHAYRVFDNTNPTYQTRLCEDPQQLNNHLDNSKRGADVLWYERMRRLWGGVAYVAFGILGEVIKTLSWLFGVKILRSSRDQEV